MRSSKAQLTHQPQSPPLAPPPPVSTQYANGGGGSPGGFVRDGQGQSPGSLNPYFGNNNFNNNAGGDGNRDSFNPYALTTGAYLLRPRISSLDTYTVAVEIYSCVVICMQCAGAESRICPPFWWCQYRKWRLSLYANELTYRAMGHVQRRYTLLQLEAPRIKMR